MNLIGKKVFGIDGPGQFPSTGLCGSEGVVVREEIDRWGGFWVVKWESGHEEQFSKHTVKPANRVYGIGVYYEI